jgi:hypothetical protein
MADPRLRGRVPEQAVLADLIADTSDGTAGAVLIDGPAGIGKSRLVQDAARLAAENAIDSVDLLGLAQPLGEGLGVLGEVQVRRGDLAAAKSVVGRLRPLLAEERTTGGATWASALLADAQGDPARALAEVAEPLQRLAERHYRLGVPDPPQLAQLTELSP